MTKWNKKTAFKHAKKFKKFRTFDREAAGCYKYLKRYGWLDEAVSHMERGKQTFWTLERLKEEVTLLTTRTSLYRNSRGAYNAALKNNFLDILYPKVAA